MLTFRLFQRISAHGARATEALAHVWCGRERCASRRCASRHGAYPVITADRRPIDPAPIIQLRVITHEASSRDRSASGASDHSGGAAAGCSSASRLRRGVPVTTQRGEGWEDKAWYLENPYYFMYAMLADADTDEELHLLQDGKTRYTTGSCVSCLYHLKDIDGSHQGFFVFPDLSIRVEGRYRLKLCLFETIG